MDKKEGTKTESESHEGIEGEISILKHLIDSLDDSEKKLEEFYKNNDPENLNKIKRSMIQLTEKISEIVK